MEIPKTDIIKADTDKNPSGIEQKIQTSPETEADEIYDEFVKWVDSWGPSLRNTGRILIFTAPRQKRTESD